MHAYQGEADPETSVPAARAVSPEAQDEVHVQRCERNTDETALVDRIDSRPLPIAPAAMTDSPSPDKYRTGLTQLEGGPCVVCEDGTLEVSTFTKTREQGDTTLIVKEVPALLCDTCGDVTYTQAIGQRLDHLLEAAVAADRTTIVRPFTPENAS